jgi:hypothetical protein
MPFVPARLEASRRSIQRPTRYKESYVQDDCISHEAEELDGFTMAWAIGARCSSASAPMRSVIDPLAERNLRYQEDAARNNGIGSATPFSSMGPSASNRSRTRSRSASNVLHPVSRKLQARIATI